MTEAAFNQILRAKNRGIGILTDKLSYLTCAQDAQCSNCKFALVLFR